MPRVHLDHIRKTLGVAIEVGDALTLQLLARALLQRDERCCVKPIPERTWPVQPLPLTVVAPQILRVSVLLVGELEPTLGMRAADGRIVDPCRPGLQGSARRESVWVIEA